MRTKTLNIKLDGVLLCGGPGFKVYSVESVHALVLDLGKTKYLMPEGHDYHATVMAYVNLKYNPMKDQITQAFNELIEELKS